MCVYILLGVFCAIIRKGRERENTALFIHTAVNSDAACFRFTSSVKHPGFQANNTSPPFIPKSFGRSPQPLLRYSVPGELALSWNSALANGAHCTQHTSESIC